MGIASYLGSGYIFAPFSPVSVDDLFPSKDCCFHKIKQIQKYLFLL